MITVPRVLSRLTVLIFPPRHRLPVIGVKSAEKTKEMTKKGDVFLQVDAGTIFFLFDISEAAEAERFISSAELAVIVGNQPLKLF